MEGLLILVAEILLAPIIAGVALLLQALVGVVSFLVELVLSLLGKGGSGKAKPRRTINLPPGFVKGVGKVSLGLFTLTVLFLMVLNFFFLEPVVRFVVDKASEKTGIEMAYSEMSGSLFSGAFSFSDIELEREGHPQSDFDISFGQIEANLAVTKFLFGKRVLDSFSVSEGTIDVTLKEKALSRSEDGVAISVEIGEERGFDVRVVEKGQNFIQEIRHPKFVFEKLSVADLKIEVNDSANGRGSYRVQVEAFEAEPLRSRFLWFDILFRSNLRGSLNASELTISNREEGQRRYTSWTVRGVDAPTLNSLVGGPFRLFDAGKIDVEVSDDWELEKSPEINMDWKLRIREGRAAVPVSTPRLLEPFALGIVEHINQKIEPWEFGFTLTMSESQFRGSASLDAQQIWGDALPATLDALADEFSLSRDAVREGADKILGGLKRLMESRNADDKGATEQ